MAALRVGDLASRARVCLAPNAVVAQIPHTLSDAARRPRGTAMVINRWIVAGALGVLLGGGATLETAHAKGYHYHAPRVSTYNAPKVRSVVPVRSYIKRDGTYVMPSHRTSPNATRVDNWSSKPNINPYTGKLGTKDPYAPPSSGG